jgi:nitrite reductase/ring-hydroxylating ferredoxin subunit
MAEFVTVGKAGEVGEGSMRVFEVDGQKVGVARLEGAFHGFSDVCTHRGCNLMPDDLEGTEIECECHGSVFDVTTGAVINGPAEDPLPMFQVRQEGDELQIAI